VRTACARPSVRRLLLSGLRPIVSRGSAPPLSLRGGFTAPITVHACGGGIYGGQTHSQSRKPSSPASGIRRYPETATTPRASDHLDLRNDDPSRLPRPKRLYNCPRRPRPADRALSASAGRVPRPTRCLDRRVFPRRGRSRC
jgi:hypothetical protein